MASETPALRQGSQRQGALPGSEGASFARIVSALLERVEYRRCEGGEDMEAISRIRYKAYRAHGFVPESTTETVMDAMDQTENCYNFGVFIDGELVSTVRLHHITAENPAGPIMKVFGDVLEPKLDRGESFINPTLLAADPEFATTYRAIPYLTLRLAVVANNYFRTSACVCMIREEHTAFYARIFGASQVGRPRPYPPFSVPVMLYSSDIAVNMPKTLARFPFFRSSPLEQRLLFSKPAQGELAPLTILPSTRYHFSAAA